MKSFTTLLFFIISSILLAQNSSFLTKLPTKSPKKSAEEWDFSFGIGLSSTYTEGVFKEFVKSNMAVNVGIEVRTPHVVGLAISIRPASLQQTFTNDNRVWTKDTSISLVSLQGSFGYQFWTSKKLSLYLFGAFGVHHLTAGKSCNDQNNGTRSTECSEKKKGWELASIAPSTGFFFDFNLKKHLKGLNDPSHNSYLRLKFTANPLWFRQIGKGVLYDMGIAYCL